ncbi:hypothetical protein [Clostridium sp. VAP23]|uniref:hypothetical protein n=1 Tax=Clostridium sp. VAP23 TaxID=2949981 RepID=UPI0020794246|nr:hypothetical protein [Clostridium sp. VAP23]
MENLMKNNKENLIASEPLNNTDEVFKNLQEQIDSLHSINNSLNVLINTPLCNNPIIRNRDIYNILKENKKVDIRFKFNWNDYTSVIKIIGKDNNEEHEYITPQIPLIGGAWSNLVATRCLTGQVFVSALLECVKIQLEFIAKDNNLNTEIIKHDNCFYAPFMQYKVDDNGKLAHGYDENTHTEYHELLKKHYPKAYEQIRNLREGENYWDKYHDIK